MAQLTVRVLRGSAAQQQEFALITFTNKGTKACSLFGFPGVSLRRANALLGQPADRSPKTPPHTVKLAPGEQAETTITDFSSCQAPLSDTVRVYPPNLREFVDKPLELRGCQIVVDPVTHS
ncbi:MAG: putative secreted protein [Pseudonocardiales bacterium]|nr:putative secreted protein [Pseudonocardiales bacterium]